MISIKQAQAFIAENIQRGEVDSIPVSHASGFVLAKPIVSKIDMPPFSQSAMDGYALKLNGAPTFKLVGEIAAGDGAQPNLKEGEAIRIFTGAMVPADADCIVRQEDVEVKGGMISVNPVPKPMANIRPQGEQLAKGSLAMPEGVPLNPATIGYIAGLGIVEVSVFKKPSVAVVVTGNELVQPGQSLQPGQIYESNGSMLMAALTDYGINNIKLVQIPDNYQETEDQLKTLLDSYDFVLCSGGISVGDYDYVGKALQNLGVEEVFYKVNQKPGKPLFFGKRGNCSVFGLPGNPAAALTCFYVYVHQALDIFSGKPCPGLIQTPKILAQDFSFKCGRDLLLKAQVCGPEVVILDQQSSAMLGSFAKANSLVYLPATNTDVKKGTNVDTILLPK